jgi:hypothetical protein
MNPKPANQVGRVIKTKAKTSEASAMAARVLGEDDVVAAAFGECREPKIGYAIVRIGLELEKQKSPQRRRVLEKRLDRLDAELKRRGYVARMICLGCGAMALVSDPKKFWGVHAALRTHARIEHAETKADILGEPILKGYAWTDDLIAVKSL